MAKLSPRTAGVAFVWGVAEAILFFVVADVLLSWVALKHGLRAAVLAALLAAAGATLGGEVLYAWSARSPDAARAVELVPAVADGSVDRAAVAMRHRPWWVAPLKASFGGGPYKVYAAAAPRAGIGPLALALATPLIRLPRFLLVSLVFALLAPILRRRLTPRRTAQLFAAGWTLFYGLYWVLVPW